MNDDGWKQFEQLRDAAIDGRITADELALLESMVLADSAMRRNYVEHAHQQATLRMIVEPMVPSVSITDFSSQSVAPSNLSEADRFHSASRSRHLIWYAMASAAIALLAIGFSVLLSSRGSETQVAMITSAEDCRWGDCTLATAERLPLGAGMLRLESGIATLRFPNVNVTLEGQVELEIVDQKTCFVRYGRIFANVEPGGEGFVVQTPTATFVDRGTTFGVRVGGEGTSDLTVFKGRVDVNHRATASEVIARVNDRVRVSEDKLMEYGQTSFPSLEGADRPTGLPIHISTALGVGEDAYLSAGEVVPANSSTTALLVKKPAQSNPGQWYARWRRKAFMRFDLSGIESAAISKATFQLHGVATNIGFASMMPDAEFAVYGLIDESQDDWDANKITWLGCPANAGDTLLVDEKAAVLIGKFVVPQSNPEGRFEISNSSLLDFLHRDTNDRVTFILIPESVGEEGASYVHGFASKRHPYLAAPTLRLRVK